jgi:hypothetical protein
VTAVPDPRFRDQLAEALWKRAAGDDAPPLSAQMEGTQRVARADADALLPLIAAHVEAEVQAALNDAAADLEYRAGKVSPDVGTGFLGAAGRVREIVTELNTSAEGEQPKERPPCK